MAETLVREIADDINNAVQRALHRMTTQAHALSREARRAAMRGGDAAANAADTFAQDTATQSRRAVRFANRELRDHPISTLAAGAVLGAIAAYVLTRRA